MNKLILCLALLAMTFVGPAIACSTGAWWPTVGMVESSEDFPRYSGLCAMRASGAGYVQDNSPILETNFTTRFYFFAEGAGNTTILIAYADESGMTPVYELRFDGSQVALDASASGGSTLVVSAQPDRWHSVEFGWRSDGAMNLWVDSDARTDPADASGLSGSGSVGSMRLGAPSGLGGFSSILFDDYFSSRTTIPIGRILRCDANNDRVVDQNDFALVKTEFLSSVRSNGQADCNEDGVVNSGDLGVTIVRDGSQVEPLFVTAIFVDGFEDALPLKTTNSSLKLNLSRFFFRQQELPYLAPQGMVNPGFDIGNAMALNGQSDVLVPLGFLNPGENITAADLTFGFDKIRLTATTDCNASIGAAGHTIGCAVDQAAGTVRILISPLFAQPIPIIDGSILGSIVFQVATDANNGVGDLPLELTILAISHTNDSESTTNCQSLPDVNCQASNGTLTIAEQNQAPMAAADSLLLSEGDWVNVAPGCDMLGNGESSLLANDMDANGDNLSINTTPVLGPQHALAFSLETDGSFSYTHDGSESVSDSFTYEVCDDGSPVECSQATVSLVIDPVNDRPTPVPDLIIVASGATASSLVGGNISVLDNDSDVESDGLTASTTALLGPRFASAFILNSDGSFSYTHDGSDSGCDLLIYQVCDDGIPVACSEASVRVEVAPGSCPGLPSVLVVDDDNDRPDVGQGLAGALSRLGAISMTDQALGDINEPGAVRMSGFDMVLWLTGDQNDPSTGPSSISEAEISRYLDAGGCFVISAQNWLGVRGQSNDTPTPLMSELGLASGTSDQTQGFLTGNGPVFSGQGFALDFSELTDGVDLLNPTIDAQPAFSGDAGAAALQRRGPRGDSLYFGFPVTAVPEENQLRLLDRVLDYCGEKIFIQGFENL